MIKKEKEEIKKDKLERLKNIIKEAGYTQAQLAGQLGITNVRINRYLNGKAKFPKVYADKLEEILFLSKEEKEYIFNKNTAEVRKPKKKKRQNNNSPKKLRTYKEIKTNPYANIYMVISEEGIDSVARAFIYGIEHTDYECLRVGAEAILNSIRGINIKTKIIEKK